MTTVAGCSTDGVAPGRVIKGGGGREREREGEKGGNELMIIPTPLSTNLIFRSMSTIQIIRCLTNIVPLTMHVYNESLFTVSDDYS